MDANAPLQDDFETQGAVDSDEERDNVMKSINSYYRQDPYTGGRTMGSPLETYTAVPLRRRYNYIRLKGAMQQALGGVHGAKLFATPTTLSSGLFDGPRTDMSAMSATLESFDSSRRPSIAASQRPGHSTSRKPSISGPV